MVTPQIMADYLGQARLMIHWHSTRACFLVHDTAMGCFWAESFATYDDAVTAIYHIRHLGERA